MISTCLIGRVKKTQSTPQEEVLSLRKEAEQFSHPQTLDSPATPTGLRESLQDGQMASEWSEKLIMRNDGWEIDGVGKHTYNLELACKLMGEAEEEALFTHWLLVTQKGLEGSKLHFGETELVLARGSQSSAQDRRKMAGPFLGWARSPHWHRRKKNLQPVSWKGCCDWLRNQVLKRWRRVDPGRRGSRGTALVLTHSEPMS